MEITVAATQMACSWDIAENLDRAERLIRRAAEAGAQVVLPQEMVAMHFFGFMDWDPAYFAYAETVEESRVVARMADLARELGVVIPVNFFERANNAYYNTVAVLDADGTRLGQYRKTHIPGGPPGCFEKIYTSPGDTGFRVWETAHGRVGCAVCWDQWFPESARAMALMGADVLFYPTAIGTDCHGHWQRAMQGHAAANLTPLVAANRIGRESGEFGTTEFWGRSFIADETGAVVAEAGAGEEVITASFDMTAIRAARANWGVFRDRRPEAYGPLMTLDGRTRAAG